MNLKNKVINILIFGASTTYGCWDPQGGWVARLRRFLDERQIKNLPPDPMYLVYNLGVPGDFSQDLIKRFDDDITGKVDPEEENIILLHIGVNDSMLDNKTGQLKYHLDQFEENLNQLISMARKYSQKIVLVGSMPVDSRVDPIPWLPDCAYKDEYLAKFNEVIEEVAKEEGVYFIEVYNHFVGGEYQHLLADGVHPTTEGHQKVFEIVRDFLLDKKFI